MQLRFPHHKAGREIASAVWIAVPIVIVGLGLAVYLRRKRLGANRDLRRWVEPDNLPVLDTPSPTDEWVSDPQIRSDAPTSLPGTTESISITGSERVVAHESEQNIPRADEFVIPTLVPALAKSGSRRSATSKWPDRDFESLSQPPSPSRRRGARRVAAAALTFLVTAAIVYGTVGAVRSHQKITGPLLSADTASGSPADPPAEGPNLQPAPPDPAPALPADTASPAPTEGFNGDASSQSPRAAETATPPARQQRKHVRHPHSRRSPAVSRHSKPKVPWKVRF